MKQTFSVILSVFWQLPCKMCQNVYDSVRPLHFMSRLPGYALFTIDFESFEVKFTKTDAVFTALNFAFTLGLNFIYWNSIFSINIRDAEIVNCFYPMVAYINFVIFTCAKFWNFSQRYNFGQLLKTIHEIDEELLTFAFKFDYREHRKFVFKMMIFINLAQLYTSSQFFVCQNYSNMKIENTAFLFTSWGFLSCLVLVNQFITSVSAVKKRYKAMNSVIE